MKEQKGCGDRLCGDRLCGDAAEYRVAALSGIAEAVEIVLEAAARGNELA